MEVVYNRRTSGYLELVKLAALMQLTSGNPDVRVGLIDGPVALDHPDLAVERMHSLRDSAACSLTHSSACAHGTFVAGILSARRASAAPAICPDCTLLIRPVFGESPSARDQMPIATPDELAEAILDCIAAGSRVLNLSLALTASTLRGEQALKGVLDYAAKRGVVVVAAAGNQDTVGSSCITRHPWVIPIASCSLQGRPIGGTNLGCSIGTRGLSAPGDNITSLGTGGSTVAQGGTSVATPFVTGTVALLWSVFPTATAADVKLAVIQAGGAARRSVTPPLLDGWGAYQALANGRTAPSRLRES
jgi:subtilisin family serine protease